MAEGGPLYSLQLAVADLTTTEAFYVGILDLPVKRIPTMPGAPEQLVLRLDGFELVFVEEEAVLRTHPILTDLFENIPKGVGITFHLRVEGIEEIADAIEEEGLQVLYPLEEKPYGCLELWCFDPDGYLLVLEEQVA